MKLPTVTIGTSAYNEEDNILNLLNTIQKQHQKGFRINEIIVISDGSTDNTVKLAKSLKDKRIHIFAHLKRGGVPKRVNEIFQQATGDYLIMIDSDMVFESTTTLEKFIEYFKKEGADFITGSVKPLKGITFIEKAVNAYRYGRFSIQNKYDWGKTAFSAHAYMGFTKKLYKKFSIPKKILNHDAYSYFYAKSHGYMHVHAIKSVGLYRSPGKFFDTLFQFARHRTGGLQLETIFGKDTVRNAFVTPAWVQKYLLKYQLKASIPGYIFLKVIHILAIFVSFSQRSNFEINWRRVTSAKKLNFTL